MVCTYCLSASHNIRKCDSNILKECIASLEVSMNEGFARSLVKLRSMSKKDVRGVAVVDYGLRATRTVHAGTEAYISDILFTRFGRRPSSDPVVVPVVIPVVVPVVVPADLVEVVHSIPQRYRVYSDEDIGVFYVREVARYERMLDTILDTQQREETQLRQQHMLTEHFERIRLHNEFILTQQPRVREMIQVFMQTNGYTYNANGDMVSYVHENIINRRNSFWDDVVVKKPLTIVLQQTTAVIPAKKVEECGICFESVKHNTFVVLNCGHEFCETCIKGTLDNIPNRASPSCAFCRREMTTFTANSTRTFNNMQKLLHSTNATSTNATSTNATVTEIW